MNDSIKWAAELAHVREVSLLGTADLAFWQDRLSAEGLVPAAKDGKAQLLIITAAAKFLGIPFRELSFSVLVRYQEQHEGAFLLRAFNSCRCFAFCERVFFSTPYYYGDVRVSTLLPAAIHLAGKGGAVFRVEMGARAAEAGRQPTRSGEDGWEGPVFLPEGRRDPSGHDRAGKLFVARIRGDTQAYPFLPHEDSLTITPGRDSETLQALLDSYFTPSEWLVRPDAKHAKSKTYTRSDGLARIASRPRA